MESLASAVQLMSKSNKAIREAIEKSADEVGQLEKFEDHFRSTEERFSQFKETVISNNRQADELLLRLEQNLLEKRQTADELRRQIADLKHERKKRDEENKELEKALDDNVAHLKSINISLTGPHLNRTTPVRGKIIERLMEDVA